MNIKDSLEKIVVPLVTSLGYSFEGLVLKHARMRSTICVYIDKPSGVTCDDCQQVSKKLNFILSAEEGLKQDYLLEISSPGLDRLLFTAAQYEKQIGKVIRLLLKIEQEGQKNFKGTLQSVEGDTIALELETAGGSKKFAINDIEWARIVPQW